MSALLLSSLKAHTRSVHFVWYDEADFRIQSLLDQNLNPAPSNQQKLNGVSAKRFRLNGKHSDQWAM